MCGLDLHKETFKQIRAGFWEVKNQDGPLYFVFSNLILVFEALKAFLVCGHPKGSRSPAPAAFALGQ